MTDLYGQCNHCGENLTAGHSCSGMLRNRAFFDAHSVKLRPSYDAIAAERDALAARLAEALRLLRRYRTETPLGHQPHMIAHEADAVLRTADSATEVQP